MDGVVFMKLLRSEDWSYKDFDRLKFYLVKMSTANWSSRSDLIDEYWSDIDMSDTTEEEKKMLGDFDFYFLRDLIERTASANLLERYDNAFNTEYYTESSERPPAICGCCLANSRDHKVIQNPRTRQPRCGTCGQLNYFYSFHSRMNKEESAETQERLKQLFVDAQNGLYGTEEWKTRAEKLRDEKLMKRVHTNHLFDESEQHLRREPEVTNLFPTPGFLGLHQLL